MALKTGVADSQGYHCAFTLTVRPGMEQAYEQALKRFASRSLHSYGTTGMLFVRPAPGSNSREYGILRSFLSKEDADQFYESDLFKKWLLESENFVEEGPVERSFHGLEAFFRGKKKTQPPEWKMALITWMAVFFFALFWSKLLADHLTMLHPIAVTGIVIAAVVISLTWGIMPWLTRLLGSWLNPD